MGTRTHLAAFVGHGPAFVLIITALLTTARAGEKNRRFDTKDRKEWSLLAGVGACDLTSDRSNVDVLLGVGYTRPVVFDFLHLDVDLALSGAPLIGRRPDELEYHMSTDTLYEYVTSREYDDVIGLGIVGGVYPTLYLRRAYVGVGVQMSVHYEQGNVRLLDLQIGTHDTLWTSRHNYERLYRNASTVLVRGGWHKGRIALGIEISDISVRFMARLALAGREMGHPPRRQVMWGAKRDEGKAEGEAEGPDTDGGGGADAGQEPVNAPTNLEQPAQTSGEEASVDGADPAEDRDPISEPDASPGPADGAVPDGNGAAEGQ